MSPWTLPDRLIEDCLLLRLSACSIDCFPSLHDTLPYPWPSKRITGRFGSKTACQYSKAAFARTSCRTMLRCCSAALGRAGGCRSLPVLPSSVTRLLERFAPRVVFLPLGCLEVDSCRPATRMVLVGASLLALPVPDVFTLSRIHLCCLEDCV